MDCSPPAPLSMEFSRQEYWSKLPFPPPGDLPNQWLNPHLLHWQVGSLPLSPRETQSWKECLLKILSNKKLYFAIPVGWSLWCQELSVPPTLTIRYHLLIPPFAKKHVLLWLIRVIQESFVITFEFCLQFLKWLQNYKHEIDMLFVTNSFQPHLSLC